MSWLTMSVAGVLLVSAALGWRAGLIRRVLELAGIAASIMVAAHWAGPMAVWLEASTGLSSRVAAPAGWILVVVIGIIIARVVAWGVSKLVRLTVLGWIDKAGGAVFGTLAGALLASVVLIVAANLPPNEELQGMIRDEPLPRLIHGAAPTLWNLVAGKDSEPGDLWDSARDSAKDMAQELGQSAAAAAADARDAAVKSAVETARDNADSLREDAVEAAEKIAEDIADGKGS